jgi:hypothetical protein
MATKDHGSSVKDDKQYEGLRKKGMSKQRAARIANTSDASQKGGKASGSGKRNTDSSQGGTKAQKGCRRTQGRQGEQHLTRRRAQQAARRSRGRARTCTHRVRGCLWC